MFTFDRVRKGWEGKKELAAFLVVAYFLKILCLCNLNIQVNLFIFYSFSFGKCFTLSDSKRE